MRRLVWNNPTWISNESPSRCWTTFDRGNPDPWNRRASCGLVKVRVNGLADDVELSRSNNTISSAPCHAPATISHPLITVIKLRAFIHEIKSNKAIGISLLAGGRQEKNWRINFCSWFRANNIQSSNVNTSKS